MTSKMTYMMLVVPLRLPQLDSVHLQKAAAADSILHLGGRGLYTRGAATF